MKLPSKRLILTAVFAAFVGSHFGQPASAGDAVDASGWLRLQRMIRKDVLSEDQVFLIRRALEDQQAMVSLFEKYGGQSIGEMEIKRRNIRETTDFRINSVLNDEQREQWKKRPVEILRRTPVRYAAARQGNSL